MANLDTPATRGLGDKIGDAVDKGKDFVSNLISGNDTTASAEAATNSASSVVDANNLTAIFDQIKGAIDDSIIRGLENLTDPLLGLLFTLTAIGIMLNFEMYFQQRVNWGQLFVKLAQATFFAFLIRNWHMIVSIFQETSENLGLTAAGKDTILTAGSIINEGVGQVFKYFAVIFQVEIGLNTFILGFFGIIILLIALFGFMKIAYTLFTTNVEFLIVASLSVILLPFYMTKWTQNVADKAWGILFTCTMKLIVCNFMIGLLSSYITNNFVVSKMETLTTAKNLSGILPEMILKTLGILFIAFLITKTVEFAGAMTSGLTISDADPVTPSSKWAWNKTGGRIFGKVD
ncbi:MAG: type IV secretion system protein [Veillonella sp.]|uniref:type IV secretion system protein n=1 Tax=Veillonella sp. TaxID=1926307 RepID=UPI00290E5E43|nr:type IV secretion system protein [Veillonella sp.]MDU4514591.1 type IV secretion system protein [Veillonella sp.]